MGLIKKVLEIIIGWIGPVGLLIVLVAMISIYLFYAKIIEDRLTSVEVLGLAVLSIVAVGLVNLIIKTIKKKKTQIT
jgi:hypothetical protein